LRRITSFGTASVVPLVLFALGLGLIALNGCGPPDLSVKPPPSAITPVVDLAHVACNSDDRGNARAEGELTNTSGELKAFEVVVQWYDEQGAYYASASAPTALLPDEALFSWEVVADVPSRPGGVCEVFEVIPLPSEEDS